MQDILDRHLAISELWNETQAYLKEAEQETGYLFTPAMNEMRYASRKLLDVWIAAHSFGLTKKPTKSKKAPLLEKLIIAEQYLVNAHHDITDEIINNHRHSLKLWAENYGVGVFQGITGKKATFETMLSEAEKFVSQSRENRENRKAMYRELRSKYVPKLIAEYNDLEKSLIETSANVLAREEHIAKLESTVENTNEQLVKMRHGRQISIAIGLAGVIIGLSRFIG